MSAATLFDRTAWAHWYADQHMKVDPGVKEVHFLPENAPEREIRLIEVNTQLTERLDDDLQPFDFGVDSGTENEHRLWVLDVTPAQWQRIQQGHLSLPRDWTLQHSQLFRA